MAQQVLQYLQRLAFELHFLAGHLQAPTRFVELRPAELPDEQAWPAVTRASITGCHSLSPDPAPRDKLYRNRGSRRKRRGGSTRWKPFELRLRTVGTGRRRLAQGPVWAAGGRPTHQGRSTCAAGSSITTPTRGVASSRARTSNSIHSRSCSGEVPWRRR